MTSHPTQQPQHQPETVDAETGLSPEQTAAAEGRHTGTRQDDGYRQDEELRKDDGLRDDELRRGGDDDL
ncbi:MAG TPA: hypothetical protein VK894_05665, partial [Jiangellales bacterium]|nr:hypothetical protein [Jiangellales bacterium]